MGILARSVPTQKSLKAGFFGPAGSGKSLTSMLVAIGLSKQYHDGAAIGMMDTEDQSSFLEPICSAEGVELRVVKSRAFVDLVEAVTEAEQSGCCAFICDSYSHVPRELEDALKEKTGYVGRKLPWHHREQFFAVWESWIIQMRQSPLHMFLNGRLSFDWDDVESEAGQTEKVKVGTKMMGDSQAGYEPDLLIEMDAIRDSLVRTKTTKTKRGQMKHAAVVLKDRWMALNGKTIVWPDLNDYAQGDYEAVYKAFLPHIDKLRLSQSRTVTQPQPRRRSVDLFDAPRGESVFAERTRRATIAVEELQAALSTIWPGQTADDKRLKNIVLETLFQSRSWTKIETLLPEVLESALATMRLFEEAAQDGDNNVKSEASVIALIQNCVDTVKASQDAVSVL